VPLPGVSHTYCQSHEVPGRPATLWRLPPPRRHRFAAGQAASALADSLTLASLPGRDQLLGMEHASTWVNKGKALSAMELLRPFGPVCRSQLNHARLGHWRGPVHGPPSCSSHHSRSAARSMRAAGRMICFAESYQFTVLCCHCCMRATSVNPTCTTGVERQASQQATIHLHQHIPVWLQHREEPQVVHSSTAHTHCHQLAVHMRTYNIAIATG